MAYFKGHMERLAKDYPPFNYAEEEVNQLIHPRQSTPHTNQHSQIRLSTDCTTLASFVRCVAPTSAALTTQRSRAENSRRRGTVPRRPGAATSTATPPPAPSGAVPHAGTSQSQSQIRLTVFSKLAAHFVASPVRRRRSPPPPPPPPRLHRPTRIGRSQSTPARCWSAHTACPTVRRCRLTLSSPR